jgi:hypothetical protein
MDVGPRCGYGSLLAREGVSHRARVAVCHLGFVNGLGSDETVERCALLYPAWCIVWTASYMMTSSYLF